MIDNFKLPSRSIKGAIAYRSEQHIYLLRLLLVPMSFRAIRLHVATIMPGSSVSMYALGKMRNDDPSNCEACKRPFFGGTKHQSTCTRLCRDMVRKYSELDEEIPPFNPDEGLEPEQIYRANQSDEDGNEEPVYKLHIEFGSELYVEVVDLRFRVGYSHQRIRSWLRRNRNHDCSIQHIRDVINGEMARCLNEKCKKPIFKSNTRNYCDRKCRAQDVRTKKNMREEKAIMALRDYEKGIPVRFLQPLDGDI